MKDLQKLLRPGEAVLSSFVGKDHIFLWLITEKTQKFERLSVTPEEVAALITRLRNNIDPNKNPNELHLSPNYRLYEILFARFSKQIQDVTDLIFVPNGSLDALPLGTLLTEKPKTEKLKLKNIRAYKLPWFIRNHAIGIVPSLASIQLLRKKFRKVRADRPFLGIGDPNFNNEIKVASATMRAVIANRAYVASLPETAEEIARIGRLLGANPKQDIFVGNQASETKLKTTPLDNYRVISIATHGVIAGEIAKLAEPALVLSIPPKPTQFDDGLLTASEVMNLKLNAELVMLSACNTASSDGQPRAEGLSGLARAFFFAGARNLIVTHWTIPSDPAVELSVGMIEVKTTNPSWSWSRALQASIQKLIDEKGPEHFAYPYSWGAHMAVGVAQ